MPQVLLSLYFLLLALTPVASAQTLSVPNVFNNGTAANADEVNANFGAVKTVVDSHDGRIAAAQSDATVALGAANAAAAGHTVDTNTQLTAAEVAAAATAEGFVAGPHTVDTNTQLSESEVDAFVDNNGYGLAANMSVNTAAISGLTTAISGPRATGYFAYQNNYGTHACLDTANGLIWHVDPVPAARTYDESRGYLQRLNGRVADSPTGGAPPLVTAGIAFLPTLYQLQQLADSCSNPAEVASSSCLAELCEAAWPESGDCLWTRTVPSEFADTDVYTVCKTVDAEVVALEALNQSATQPVNMLAVISASLSSMDSAAMCCMANPPHECCPL
ncbi:hypothetical protein MK489_14135 [Myxococcota bacterium]|nr:hypothetical protein [Myxococcota bacterium]